MHRVTEFYFTIEQLDEFMQFVESKIEDISEQHNGVWHTLELLRDDMLEYVDGDGRELWVLYDL